MRAAISGESNLRTPQAFPCILAHQNIRELRALRREQS